jgi:carbonic anhydrase
LNHFPRFVGLVLPGSEITAEMEKNNEVEIIGGIYDVENGHVSFLE